MEWIRISSLDGRGSLLPAAYHDSILLQAIVPIFVILCSTRILSSYRFKSIKHGNGNMFTPPTLPYWIPFLRHALPMAWDAQRFTARCLNKYGSDGTPFFIDAAGHKLLILLDPNQIKRVINAPKELDPNPFIQDRILEVLLGTPKATIDFYKSDNGQLDHVQVTHIRQHVTGSSLIALSKRVFERLTFNVDQLFTSRTDSEWVEIADLYEFVQDHVTRAITESLMGTKITEEYPELYADLWLFIDKATEIVTGLPRFVIPAAYAARDRLLANLKQWSLNSEALRSQYKVDRVWDTRAGSALLQERQELYAKSPGFDEDARVSQILGLLFAGNSITPSISFWYLFEALRDPKVFDQVSAEMNAYSDPKTRRYDFMQLTVRPILQSLHAEATRFYASNVTARVVTSPTFALDDKYVITKDTTLFVYNKFTGQYNPGWSEARPQAASKPLDEFWAERFLVSGDGKRERFSDAGFSGCWTSFGGGEHKCPGRHFARNIGIVTLAAFLGEFECRLTDPQAAQNTTPPIKETAFGKMEPTHKISARIRRRQV